MTEMTIEKIPNLYFGNVIKAIRLANNMSKYRFKIVLGISSPYLYHIETGKYIPSREKVIKIAKNANVNKDALLVIAGYSPENIALIMKEGVTVYKAYCRNLYTEIRNIQEKYKV